MQDTLELNLNDIFDKNGYKNKIDKNKYRNLKHMQIKLYRTNDTKIFMGIIFYTTVKT
jgi:hypothetical protein